MNAKRGQADVAELIDENYYPKQLICPVNQFLNGFVLPPEETVRIFIVREDRIDKVCETVIQFLLQILDHASSLVEYESWYHITENYQYKKIRINCSKENWKEM